MTPVVLELYGRTATGAQTIFNRIIHHRLQILVRHGIPFSHDKRVASPRKTNQMQGIRPKEWLELAIAGQGHDPSGPNHNLTELPPGHRPSSIGSLTTAYNSLSDKECHSPMQRGSPAPSCGAPSPVPCSKQLLSSMAGTRGVYSENWPGRSGRNSP